MFIAAIVVQESSACIVCSRASLGRCTECNAPICPDECFSIHATTFIGLGTRPLRRMLTRTA